MKNTWLNNKNTKEDTNKGTNLKTNLKQNAVADSYKRLKLYKKKENKEKWYKETKEI